MGLAKIYTAAICGIKPHTVEVEINAPGKGLETNLLVVGLPDLAVRESRERVRSALAALNHQLPEGCTTVSLAPADLKKTGAGFDLPIAVGIIMAKGVSLDAAWLEKTLLIGELALDGAVRPVRGALALSLHAREHGFTRVIVPAPNAEEASIAEGVQVYGVETLREALLLMGGKEQRAPLPCRVNELFRHAQHNCEVDFADVKGHAGVKRGLEVAAAGGHNLLMMGPPGCGKSLLAKAYTGILPGLELDEALKVTQIHSIAGTLEQPLVTRRPFRSPHHTVSQAGLLGGTSNPRPGEVSLAHLGVLFLDELPEYNRNALEVLRQPMESGEVTISRAVGSQSFPASFSLLAAMNPCPCGYYGARQRRCVCSSAQIAKYRSRISGPLLDRIDIHLEVQALPEDELMKRPRGEATSTIRERVAAARQRQHHRFGASRTNSSLKPAEFHQFCQLDKASEDILRKAVQNLGLSARAYDRILRLARTIADIADLPQIQVEHIAEAVQYRTLDRALW